MPSDFAPISGCVCVGCGRGNDFVGLKRLNTYSRTFSCVACYLKYSKCANCGHERHAYIPMIQQLYPVKPRGIHSCHCGCMDYRHGLEAEFDRQFSEHTGKAPTQRQCMKCGNYFSGAGRLCATCDKEWSELQSG
jgi:hypothetical protein